MTDPSILACRVSGVIGGRSSGIAKDVSLVDVRVLDSDGVGTTAEVIAGLDFIAGTHSLIHSHTHDV